ncbi:hypothetical protein D3C77_752490 [compost metagenome]
MKFLLAKKIKGFDVVRLAAVLEQLVALATPDGANLTQERADFILRLTRRRAELLMEKLA